MFDDDKVPAVNTIVKFCILLVIGVVLLSAIGSNSGASTHGSATFTFSGNPSDGDTVTVDNHVYEFDSGNGVAAGHTAVMISPIMVGTAQNFANVTGTNYAVSV